MKVICLKWLGNVWFWFIKNVKEIWRHFSSFRVNVCSFTLDSILELESENYLILRSGLVQIIFSIMNRVGSRFIEALSMIVIPEWSALIKRCFMIITGEKCVLTRDEECELWSAGWTTAACVLQSSARFIVLSPCWSVCVDRILYLV